MGRQGANAGQETPRHLDAAFPAAPPTGTGSQRGWTAVVTPHRLLPRDEDQGQQIHQKHREDERDQSERQGAADTALPRLLGRRPVYPTIVGHGRPVCPVCVQCYGAPPGHSHSSFHLRPCRAHGLLVTVRVPSSGQEGGSCLCAVYTMPGRCASRRDHGVSLASHPPFHTRGWGGGDASAPGPPCLRDVRSWFPAASRLPAGAHGPAACMERVGRQRA